MDRRRVDPHECQPFEPVGGARAQGASNGENNRCGSKSLIRTDLVVSDWVGEKLRLLSRQILGSALRFAEPENANIKGTSRLLLPFFMPPISYKAAISD